MNEYEKKQAKKKARYAEKAEKLREEARSTYQRARDMLHVIPAGQPILIGHHSERRDRNYRQRIDNTFARANELSKKADYYEEKANTKSDAISSDDEDAISKLEHKLEQLIALQDHMKEANRRFKKEGPAYIETLPEKAQQEILINFRYAPGGTKKPYPSFYLTNNNQNIHRIKQRITALKRIQAQPDLEPIVGDGFTLTEDKSDNRILFTFEGKPEANVRAILKRHGFKWSPTRSAWVRMLNSNGRFSAKLVIEELNKRNT